MIQLKYVGVKIFHACFTAVRWIFNANIPKAFTFTTASLKLIICVNENYNDIDKSFSGVDMEIWFVQKYGNKLK